jgi:hypothetical protein
MTIHTRETSPRLSATEKRGLEWHWVEVAGQRSQEARKALIESLVARDPQAVSQASLAQGAREAARRNALLATPWLTYEELAYMRADASVASTRTAVARLVGKHRLLTVPVPGGRTGIPAFQLDDAGRPTRRARGSAASTPERRRAALAGVDVADRPPPPCCRAVFRSSWPRIPRRAHEPSAPPNDSPPARARPTLVDERARLSRPCPLPGR